MLTRKERSERNRLAHKIAASAAQTVIESVCRPVSKGWYNIASATGEQELADLAEAICYLELIGALEHHASNRNWVRMMNLERQRHSAAPSPGGRRGK